MAILGDFPDGTGLVFEVDETGAQELVRSVASTHPVFIRFTNVTSRPVVVWWRDFRGIRRFYALLKAGEFCDINTFVTHPWEFTDEGTGERYTVGENVIFRPPKRRGDARYRTNWNISVVMRSLRDTALLRVALSLPEPATAETLGLPGVLTKDLQTLVRVLQRPRPHQQSLD